MKRITILFCLQLAFSSIIYAQPGNTGSVTGKIVDSISGANLSDATVSVLSTKDSSVLFQAVAKTDGSFLLQNIPYSPVMVQVSFQGYSTITKGISLSKRQPDYSFGTLLLTPLSIDLGVVIVRSIPPIVVRGDTTEFNASRIKTKPNATAEDLLKKIPGMEVDKEGGVTAQGEQVTKIIVDGKVFFSDDPKMATKNLPADIIDKIQIIDAQSDQSAFTGFDDGVREKVINIITKKDKRKGYFGKAVLAGGSDGRYGSDVNVSRFNGDRKISFIGKASNTNQENYSIQDILSIINVGGFGAANLGTLNFGQSGIARTYAGAINYNDVIGEKTELNGSYRYKNLNTIRQDSRFRETFVAGGASLFNDNIQYSNNRNIDHQFNFEIEHKFDSMNSLRIRPSYSRDRSNNYTETHSFLTRGKTVAEKDIRTINNSLNDVSDFNNKMLYRHRFAKRGRTLSLSLNQSYSNNHTDRTAFNYTNTYSDGAGTKTDTTNRISDISRDSKNNSARLSYTEPIGKKGHIELNYQYGLSLNKSNQVTNTYNSLTGKYDLIDTILSDEFTNVNISQKAGLNYRRQVTKELNYNVGLEVQQNELNSDNKTKNRFIEQTFRNFFPTATIQYKKSRKSNFRFQYRGSTRQPNVNQLQDVVDNTNLLNIVRGNPELKQEFSNDLNFRYTKIDAGSSKNLIIRLSGSITANRISNAITINTSSAPIYVDNIELLPFARYSKPVNLSGAYNFKGYINYGFPIKKIGSTLNFSTDLSHNRDVNLVNGVTSFTRNYGVGEKIRLTMNIKDRFDLNFSSSSRYNIASYSLNRDQNRNFFTQSFSIEPTYSTKSGWIIESNFDYSKRFGQAAGYNQAIPLLHASLSKLMFKQKQGELKLSVFDALNQNKSITRNVEENFVEDVRTTVLQRYFLLSFIYNIRKFGM